MTRVTAPTLPLLSLMQSPTFEFHHLSRRYSRGLVCTAYSSHLCRHTSDASAHQLATAALSVPLFFPMTRTSFPYSPANLIAIPSSSYSL